MNISLFKQEKGRKGKILVSENNEEVSFRIFEDKILGKGKFGKILLAQ